MNSRALFNTILVHVSRTWERIRIEQPQQEMPVDNIGSVDNIVQIADEVFEDKAIQKFLREKDKDNWSWEEETGDCFSDSYIEGLAEKIIRKDIL
jgi:hypothetical protein